MGPDVAVIDPAPAVAQQVGRVLAAGNLSNQGSGVGRSEFLTTGEAGYLESLLPKLMGETAAVRPLTWRDGSLV